MTSDPTSDAHGAWTSALFALIDLPAASASLPQLVLGFARQLSSVVRFDDLLVVSVPLGSDQPRALALRVKQGGQAFGESDIERLCLPTGVIESVRAFSDPVVLDDLSIPGALAAVLAERGNESACLLPVARDADCRWSICLASTQAGGFLRANLPFLEHAARLFVFAADSHELGDRLGRRERELEADRCHWRTLFELNNAVVGTLDLEALRAAIATSLRRMIEFEYINLLLLDADGRRIGLFSLDPGVPESMDRGLASIRIEDSPFSDPSRLQSPFVCDAHQMAFLPAIIREDETFRATRRFCVLPLSTRHGTVGAIVLSSRSATAFTPEEVSHAAQAAGQVAIAVENALAFQEIASLKDRLAQENLYLEDEIRGWNEFGDIVGESPALQRVLAQVRSVADTDTTVLLLGETGTGKELFARAIHDLSSRKSRTLVAVNCAASPAGLLESEWFGYEKGAFTGALARKTGRFELADKGTLFLDEIGDIPLDLQAKLLRVLQEHEIERVGATRPVRLDFRLVAATNADLQGMVNDKKFRSDLYYRLSVFPIRIPPLRERPDDIPALVTCFTQRYAKRLKRQIESVPRETMQALCRWPWPGNVRELQNVIERAVILSPGRTLEISPTEFVGPAPVGGTLESAERDHILKALLDTNWVVGGSAGAAARLGLKRTTLMSTMKRLGIERPGKA